MSNLETKEIEKEIYFNATKLIDHLREDEELDADKHIANMFYCPTCECVSVNCIDIDDNHELVRLKMESWYAVSKRLAEELIKLDECVMMLDDLNLYCWGRQSNPVPQSLLLFNIHTLREKNGRKA
jgi:hypothetical protein